MASELPPPPGERESVRDAAPPASQATAPARRALARPFWNADERRLRAPWRLLGQLALLALLSWVLFAPLRPILREHRGELAWMALGRTLATLAVLASVALAARFFDRRPLGDFGLRLDRAFGADCAFGLGLGALLMTGVFGFEQWMGWIRPALGDPQATLAASTVMLVTPLGLFLAVSVSEEVLFRGYPLRVIGEGLRAGPVGPGAALVLATLVTSGLFGFGHANNPNATWVSTLNITGAGLLLSLGYVLTGRLGLSIGLHVTWNFFQGPVYGFPVSGIRLPGKTLLVLEQGGPALWTGGTFGPEAGLVGLFAMVVGGALVLAWVRWHDGRLGLCAALTRPPARGRAA